MEFATGAMTLATLFPGSASVALEVASGEGVLKTVTVPTVEVQRYQQRPEDDRDYWFLRLLYLTQFEPSEEDERERYAGVLILTLTRFVLKDIAPISGLRDQLPASARPYGAALRVALRRLGEAIAVVHSVDPPAGARPVKSRALQALRSIREGLVLHERFLVTGRWQLVRHANPDLQRGLRLLVQLAGG
jgi:hypothetical protein